MKKLFVVIFLSLMGLSFFGVRERQKPHDEHLLQVKGRGMEPTLTQGSIVRFTREMQINRFDIVQYVPPGFPERQFLGRVIGLSQELISVQYGRILINGELLNDVIDEEILYNLSPMIIPADSFFILGDNRNNSIDSHVLGPIEKSVITGKVYVADDD